MNADTAAYAAVTVLGLLVGCGELVSRYRDAPGKAVTNKAAAFYLGLNAAAAITALGLARAFDVSFGADDDAQRQVLQVLAAGFGAIAFLRTSFFVVKVGDKQVGIGPVALLDVLLSATDREVDRLRAVERAGAVTGALRGMSFDQVGDALPTYCLTLMQNVSPAECADIDREVATIRASSMDDALKVNALGLALMNVVGRRVLVAAADSLRSRILEGGVHGEIYSRLHDTIAATAEPHHRSLDVLGLTLYTAWPQLRSWLDHEAVLDGWSVSLRAVDPATVGADGPFDPAWGEETAAIVADVEAYRTSNADGLRERGVTLAVRTYRDVPAFHGFRTGDGSCFLSFLRWDDENGRFSRPHHQYEVVSAADNSPRAREFRGLFANWLAHLDGDPPHP